MGVVICHYHVSSDKNKKASQCVFSAKTSHQSQFFKAVTHIVKRKEILKKKNRCFCCSKAGHFSKQCISKITCHNFQGRHHLALYETRYSVYIYITTTQ